MTIEDEDGQLGTPAYRVAPGTPVEYAGQQGEYGSAPGFGNIPAVRTVLIAGEEGQPATVCTVADTTLLRIIEEPEQAGTTDTAVLQFPRMSSDGNIGGWTGFTAAGNEGERGDLPNWAAGNEVLI